MSDNTLERLVYLIKCWYICRKKREYVYSKCWFNSFAASKKPAS